jgi:hypothetical protein
MRTSEKGNQMAQETEAVTQVGWAAVWTHHLNGHTTQYQSQGTLILSSRKVTELARVSGRPFLHLLIQSPGHQLSVVPWAKSGDLFSHCLQLEGDMFKERGMAGMGFDPG